ncbi:MAG TPA: hypothetical protein VMF90_21625 [Rhizobiaceae bacterium]|nr:hypothetical protein [Rhizobiaceae bacterium]
MTALVLATPVGTPSLQTEALARFRADEPRFFDLAVVIAVSAIPTLFAAFVDSRVFEGVDNWVKPLKFDFALVVYLLTMVFFARFLPEATRASRRYRFFSIAVVTAIVAELIWINGAAALGTASHFNTSMIGMIIYSLMGAAAVLLTSVSAVYAVSIGRNPATGLSPVLKESVVIGLALVLPLTLVTAGTLSSFGTHFVGGTPADPAGLFFFGWARDVGDLRVAHFFATHTLHVIPLFGLAYAWFLGGSSLWPVRLAAVAYTAFVGFLFVQALMGQPFLPWLG